MTTAVFHYFYESSLQGGQNLIKGCIWPAGWTLDMPDLNDKLQFLSELDLEPLENMFIPKIHLLPSCAPFLGYHVK